MAAWGMQALLSKFPFLLAPSSCVSASWNASILQTSGLTRQPFFGPFLAGALQPEPLKLEPSRTLNAKTPWEQLGTLCNPSRSIFQPGRRCLRRDLSWLQDSRIRGFGLGFRDLSKSSQKRICRVFVNFSRCVLVSS